MHRFSRVLASRLFAAGLCACLSVPALAQISVRSVRVMGSRDTVEIEVEASDRIVPQTQVLTGPDRLVVDFPNAVLSPQVRSQSVDRGEVKDVRVGLFQAKPPITRVVLDLKAARSYQVFPYGRTVMIKVVGDGAASTASADNTQAARGPGLVNANYTTSAESVQVEAPVQPALEVTYRDGLLGIRANKATLSEVLYAVQQKTGADISIAAGAEQEKVVAEIPPAPAPEVLARLLNGSRFNFLILSAADDPNQLDRVILTTRTDPGPAPLGPVEAQNDEAVSEEPAVAQNQPNNVAQPAPPPAPENEGKHVDSPNPD
jgi:antitoxin (DNA-binding transcriptional repressor) of toxin-antitoxin stability system